MIMIYKAQSIFTGTELLSNHAVKVVDGIIEKIFPVLDINSNEQVEDLGNVILAPAFIDIQLYGAHGRLLSVYPDAETITEIANYSKNGGAAWCLPTVATHTYETIFKCVDAIKDYWQQGGEGVIGLHVEGPWINAAKRGAHKEEWIFSPTIEQAKELLEYGKGVIKLITIAPEKVSKEVVELIRSYNIIVSAGHSNATYKEAINAFNDVNINLGTHLFNAMSPLQHRAPGIVGAIMDHSKVMCSIVPDGHHVDFSAIRIAKKVMGERLFAITDAVTETAEGFYQHTLEGDKYTSNGILSGSALTMYKSFRNFVDYCNIDVLEALRMCSSYPAKALGMNDEIGRICVGQKAAFVVLTPDFQMVKLMAK